MKKAVKVILFTTLPVWFVPALAVFAIYHLYADFSEVFDEVFKGKLT